tara:strand:+ start:1742 stop:2332 length:591 start_codon:yes stop_codon:yes gene_type:complete
MKKIAQFIIFLILIISAISFYNIYFKKDETIVYSDLVKKETLKPQVSKKESQSNLIKNLMYDVKFEDNSQYSISSDLSEITYSANDEIVNMQGVIAKIIDENNLSFTIVSNYAVFNNNTYETLFTKDVKITYLDNEISSQKLLLNFDENIVTISENVLYEGLQGLIQTDNIRINLKSKNVEIFMNNSKNKIKITSK